MDDGTQGRSREIRTLGPGRPREPGLLHGTCVDFRGETLSLGPLLRSERRGQAPYVRMPVGGLTARALPYDAAGG
ncbi:hypothetical protein CLM85_02665, partial [Streptomyces albidoflavus]